MTDTGGGEAVVDDVVVTGQRRPPGDQGPFRGRFESGSGETDVTLVPQDGTEPQPDRDRCADPAERLDLNADAAAAVTTKDLEEFSKTQPSSGGRGFNEREYGAGMWQRSDGSVLRGPMTHSAQTFAEAAAAAAQGGTGRPFVIIDWTPPEPGAVPIGSVHSHGPNEGLPSGNMHNPTGPGDVGHLFGVMALREFYSGTANGSQARIYIASKDFGEYETEGPIRIHVYDQRNIASAVGGQLGPEVNPDGQACEQ